MPWPHACQLAASSNVCASPASGSSRAARQPGPGPRERQPQGGGFMIIDAHSHILSLAADPEFTVEYGREGSLCIYRSMGRVPSHRLPTEEEWEASAFSRSGWPLIGPDEALRDHPGFDKIAVLAVSPQYLDGHLIGTVDTSGLLGVEGPPDPEKCNDYIAAVVGTD